MIHAQTPGEANGWYVDRETVARAGSDWPKVCRWQPLAHPLQPSERHSLAVITVPWMDQKWSWCRKCDGEMPAMWRPDYQPNKE